MPNDSFDLRNSKILIVDDTPANIDVLRKFLALEGYKLSFATSGDKALQIVKRAQPDLILLDVMMPGMSGFDVCQALKADPATKEIPVIFLTALSETKDKVTGFNLGAVDYITKPLQYEEVLMRVTTHLKLHAHAMELERRSRESEQARHEAELANRAKTTFLANMSHELRTPLNAILGYSDLIQDEVSELGYQDIIPDLMKIQGAATQLLEIISNVLELAKIEAQKEEVCLSEVGISDLAQDLATELQPLFQHGDNQFNFHCPADVGMISADLAKLRQVLLNLLTNAAKFTSHGQIDMTLTRDGDWLNIEIADTGIGIEQEHINRIFNPFAQADDSPTRAYGGAGLGLSLTKSFCEMMGGDITVQSEPGKGSVFTVKLPAH
jgi:signal transduction histidine kinase